MMLLAGSALGRTVGYAVAREKMGSSEHTRCTFMTVGLLLQLLLFQPATVLGRYSHIVVDEVCASAGVS